MTPLKILHLSTYGLTRGSGIAADNLVKALNTYGVGSSSELYTYIDPCGKRLGNKRLSLPALTNISRKAKAVLEARISALLSRNESNIFASASLFNTNTHNYINNSPFDIIHIHWVQQGFIGIEDLGQIKKPIVWSFHDLWPMCGTEHHPGENHIDIYMSESPSKSLDHYPSTDINIRTWKRKVLAWQNLNIVGCINPSEWMQSRTQSSYLFRQAPSYVVPNPVDHTIFSQKQTVRPYPFNILLYAGNPFDLKNKNKGGEDILSLLQSREFLANWVLMLCCDSNQATSRLRSNPRIIYLGNIRDRRLLASIYQLATATIVPSRIESFSQVTSESLATGTPVIAYRTSGLQSLIRHLHNGYLATKYDLQDLIRGLEWISSKSDNSLLRLTETCTQSTEFLSYCAVARRMNEIYSHL